MTFHLPEGPPGGNLPWLPVRVLLTPPAIVADAAVGAVVIVTAPAWGTVLITAWMIDPPRIGVH